MSKIRVTSANQALFAGPAPSTGYYFIDVSGRLNNNYWDDLNNNNLLQFIDRHISLNYGVNIPKNEVKQIGQRGLVARSQVSYPTVDLDFGYYVVGVKNDLRIGLNCNYAQMHYPENGNPLYANPVSPISGLISRDTIQPTGEPFWPSNCRDKRNFFLVTTANGDEANLNKIGPSNKAIRMAVPSGAADFEVTCFSNCYLTSYETSAAVGMAPTARARYVCDSISWVLSGSGIGTPTIDPRTRNEISGIFLNIPQVIDDNSPPILNPGDITIDITNSLGSNIKDLGVQFNDISIQQYNIGLSLQREDLNSIGYKAPLDREIVFPAMVNLNFDIVVADTQSGNLTDLLKLDENYDISIKMRNPSNYESIKNTAGLIAVQYDFKKAKFDAINWTSPLNGTKTANLIFNTEIDPADMTKGLYISGLLNVDCIGDYLIYDDDVDGTSYYLAWDDESLALLNLKPVY